MDEAQLLALAVSAAESASREILAVYNSDDFQVEAKGDRSPLTRADKRAHEVIVNTLNSTGFPVLSEEGRNTPFEERKDWKYFWMVDPLDGTKEFIKRNDEFTVNIALIHGNKPVMGVVAVPVAGDVYFGASGQGVTLRRNAVNTPLPRRSPINLEASGLRVVASRSHMNAPTENFITRLRNATLVSAGSSLKFMLIAEGKADVYPRFGPTMEWDTAAAHLIINEVGLKVYRDGEIAELRYNKEDLLNPDFLVR